MQTVENACAPIFVQISVEFLEVLRRKVRSALILPQLAETPIIMRVAHILGVDECAFSGSITRVDGGKG